MGRRAFLGAISWVLACTGNGGGGSTAGGASATTYATTSTSMGSGTSAGATSGTGSSGTAGTTAATAATAGTTGTASTGGGGGWEDPVPEEFLGCEGGPTGQILKVTPADDYRSLIDTMQPGDAMRFAPGTYTEGLPLHDLVGAPGACFYFESLDPEDPARFLGSSSRNTVSLRDSRYVVVANLELDGDGKLGDAVKAEGNGSFVDHIVLSGLYIHGHDADQQVVGISTKCPAWYVWIRGNRIEGAGTGMYLGNSDGSAPFVAGLIEHNLVTRTLGYNIEIKHQNALPDLPGLPQEPTETILRHNVLSKAENANGGALARPNLLLGHVPVQGPGQSNRYLVYGNFLHENPTEALFQGEGNLALYANVFVNASGPALHVQPHNDVPRDVDIFGNTVLATGRGIRVTGADPAATQRVFGNVVFADPAIDAPGQSDNLTGLPEEAAAYLAAPQAPVGQGLDLHPQAGADLPVADYGVAAGLAAHDRDFDGRLRRAGLAGAYDGPAGPDAWSLSLAPKP